MFDFFLVYAERTYSSFLSRVTVCELEGRDFCREGKKKRYLLSGEAGFVGSCRFCHCLVVFVVAAELPMHVCWRRRFHSQKKQSWTRIYGNMLVSAGRSFVSSAALLTRFKLFFFCEMELRRGAHRTQRTMFLLKEESTCILYSCRETA